MTAQRWGSVLEFDPQRDCISTDPLTSFPDAAPAQRTRFAHPHP